MKYKKFTEEEIAIILDLYFDKKEEEYQFERGELGINATSEYSYDESFNFLEKNIQEYNGYIDLEKIILNENEPYDSEGKPQVSDDPLIDISSSVVTEIHNHKLKEFFHQSTNNVFIDEKITRKTLNILNKINEADISFKFLVEDMKKEKLKNKDLDTMLLNSLQKLYLREFDLSLNESFKNLKNTGKAFRDRFKQVIIEEFNNLKDIKKETSSKNYFNYHTLIKFNLQSEKVILNTTHRIYDILDIYNQNPQVFKNSAKLDKKDPYYFNIMDRTIKNESEDLELIYDKITKILKVSEAKKYAKPFLGSYMRLMNQKSIELFEEIKNKELDKEFIQKRLSKVATFQDSEELNKALEYIISNKKNINSEVLKTIENKKLDVNVLLNQNGKLFLEINDYKSSKSLGSSNWCISTSRNYFNEYLEGNKKHVFIFDERLSDSNELSMIALTYDLEEQKITNSHDKNDLNIIQSIQNKTDPYLLENALKKLKENNMKKEKERKLTIS